MTPASRGKGWYGLGLVLILGILGVLYLTGVLHLNLGHAKPKALCYVSPKNPNFIKEAPGKDPEGNELVPVYATPASGPPPATGPAVAPTAKPAGKTKYWRCPMDPEIVREAPGKCPMCSMDLVPIQGGGPAPAARSRGQRNPKERKIKYWVVAHGSQLCPGQTRQGPLRHGPGAGL